MPSLNEVNRFFPFGVMRPIWLTKNCETRCCRRDRAIVAIPDRHSTWQRKLGDLAVQCDAAILFAGFLGDQNAPSGPSMMPIGVAFGVGRGNSLKSKRFADRAGRFRGAALAEPQAAVTAFDGDIGLLPGGRNSMLADRRRRHGTASGAATSPDICAMRGC